MPRGTTTTEPLGVQIDRVELRSRRKMQGRSITDLAALADISFGFLGQIERGRRLPSPRTFVAICNALGLPESERHVLVKGNAGRDAA